MECINFHQPLYIFVPFGTLILWNALTFTSRYLFLSLWRIDIMECVNFHQSQLFFFTFVAHWYLTLAHTVHTKSWYGHAGVLDYLILCGFRCAFSCMFQYSLCHGMDIGTCDIVHWSVAPHNRIANRTGFSVYVVLVLNVIRYSCHYFLDRIIFHHDFHPDSCDYHWDFYGH